MRYFFGEECKANDNDNCSNNIKCTNIWLRLLLHRGKYRRYLRVIGVFYHEITGGGIVGTLFSRRDFLSFAGISPFTAQRQGMPSLSYLYVKDISSVHIEKEPNSVFSAFKSALYPLRKSSGKCSLQMV